MPKARGQPSVIAANTPNSTLLGGPAQWRCPLSGVAWPWARGEPAQTCHRGALLANLVPV